MADGPLLAFPVAEYQDRMARVRAGMADRGLDVLLVTGPENICYLSGYHTTGYHIFQCLVVPREGHPRFVLRNIEIGNVRTHSWVRDAEPVFVGDDPVPSVAGAAQALGGPEGAIGYEDQGLFLTPGVVDSLRRVLPGADFRPASGTIEGVRAVKSAHEVAMIERAAQAACAGLAAAAAACRPGATENDVAAAVYGGLIRAGSEYTGSPPFVAAGPRSATSHATVAGTPLRDGEPVWLEIPASVHRYHAGAGRVVSVGAPSANVIRYSQLAIDAAEAMMAAMRPGVAAADVDQAGRGLVERAEMGDSWNNRAAYSLGVSFPPGLGEGHVMDIKADDPRLLEAGMVFHLIPILKVPGLGAMGCTETVVVTEDGCRSLNTLPRELMRA